MALATPAELAGFLQQDLDTYTATQAVDVASAIFELLSGAKFTSTAATHTVAGRGQTAIGLPRRPVIAISQVRIEGVAIASTDYSLIGESLYRLVGWGGRMWRPEKVEVDFTYGYTSVPDDVKGAVLEIAGSAYQNPDQLVQVRIDDYAETRRDGAGGFAIPPQAENTARLYRFAGFA